ncbi:hypothetical protein DOK78_002830 [Enterococcus sp. DIV2402]|jgi:hypothetical protein|uniref:Uncharacterized protein n=1 Tax=Candidatus Enterococcus lowellii TaxID=2230877 RepID=A0ABZ2SQY4_9ENTE
MKAKKRSALKLIFLTALAFSTMGLFATTKITRHNL